MSLIHCLPAGRLVGPRLWLPSEPFDYGWGRFGCNQLRCGSCGQPVRSSIDEVERCRRYECACQSRDEYGDHLLGADAGHIHEFVTEWRCAGHPRLQLPVELDGIAVAAAGPFAAIVSQTLVSPPFNAPGFRGTSFWVQRLFRLLPVPGQQAMVSQAVGTQLSSVDPPTVRAATDFFRELPWAPGAEQLAVVADRERDRLRAAPDPGSSSAASLYARILEVIQARLAVVQDGVPVDQAALDLGRRALVAGEAGTGMILRVASCDPIWFCDHAADIVRAQPSELEFVLEALKNMPAAGRALALRDIQNIGKTTSSAVRAWIKQNPESP